LEVLVAGGEEVGVVTVGEEEPAIAAKALDDRGVKEPAGVQLSIADEMTVKPARRAWATLVRTA
jgi:hypothetical protein